MTLILSIESATEQGSVALHEDGKIIGEIIISKQRSHSKLLAGNIEYLLSKIEVAFSQLDAIAISGGPGSYTGLRIGASTAKGLCFGLNVPLIHIDTLEIMASEVSNFYSETLLCPLIDARRMEVYYAIFNSKGNIIEKSKPAIIDKDFLKGYENSELIFFGNGATKTYNFFTNPKWKIVHNIFPKANSMGNLAYKKYISGTFSDLLYYEPNYIKPFRATKPKVKYGN